VARRDFGSIRRRDSGRWQARYRDPSGRMHGRMFATRADAARFLAGVRADLDRGDWFDPAAGRVLLKDYAATWLKTRKVRGRPLAPRTIELYKQQLDNHILPRLGGLQLRQLSAAEIRAWHAALSASGPGAVTTAKCYRLLHTICGSAVADQEISRNPCAIPGAGQEFSPERPTATLTQVLTLADAVGDRWRALVLLAAFCSLRMGELAALTRRDVDLINGTVTVRGAAVDLVGRGRHTGPPKSDAGRRCVTIPAAVLPAIADHLDRYAQPGPDGLVIVGPRGGVLRKSNFTIDVWHPATRSLGLAHLHFHDLRHTGNTLAAATGASLRELMVRMGHASPQAALRYQHATRDRDEAIAQALSDLVEQVQKPDGNVKGSRMSGDRKPSPSSPARRTKARTSDAAQGELFGLRDVAGPDRQEPAARSPRAEPA
jgi:integrase